MNSIWCYNRYKDRTISSKTDLATSWRVDHSNSSNVSTYNFQNSSSSNDMDHLRSIWYDIPNLASHNSERQGTSMTGKLTNVRMSHTSSNNMAKAFSNYTEKEQSLVPERDTWTLASTDMYGFHTDPSKISNQLNDPWGITETSTTQHKNQDTDINNSDLFRKVHSWAQVVSDSTKSAEQPLCIYDVRHEKPTLSETTRYISNSYFTSNLNVRPIFSPYPPSRPYTVIKIKNVPWYISTDVLKKHLITEFNFPSTKTNPSSIHVFMDRVYGKTLGTVFVEVDANSNNFTEKFKRLENIHLQGRRLRFSLSNYDHLREMLFYNWPGNFKGGLAIAPDDTDNKYSVNECLFVSQKDLQSIQNICRNFKMYHNRKSPERPFEYLMSLITLIPWSQNKAVTTWQRDIMYESYKIVTETLKLHVYKPHHIIEDSLLSRFVRAALLCEGLSVKQKSKILKASDLECPVDLIEYITEVVHDDPLSTLV